MKRIYIAAYHQSKFGKLMAMSVPEIIQNAVHGACSEINVEPAVLDVGSIGATCNISLNEQGLLAGLMAMLPGLAGKPIESVENACASGGQAVLSVIQKLLLGWGDVGIAVGYEKMRDAEGKMDGKLIGKALGYFSHPDEREGKVFIFPHLFAEIMECYLKVHRVREEDLAQIAVAEYANARHNPYAQMRNVQITLDQAMKIEGINRYIVEGLPLKTYDCSQITDGYASLILATDEGLQKLGVTKADCVEIAGYAQATDPLKKAGRDVLRPEGAYRAMNKAYDMAGVKPKDVSVAEVHDCFTVMGPSAQKCWARPPPATAPVLVRGQSRRGRRVRHQYFRRTDCQRPSHRRHRDRHAGVVRVATPGQGSRRAAGEESARGSDVQHRGPHLRLRLHGAEAHGVKAGCEKRDDARGSCRPHRLCVRPRPQCLLGVRRP